QSPFLQSGKTSFGTGAGSPAPCWEHKPLLLGNPSKSSLMRIQRLTIGSAVVRLRYCFKSMYFWSFLAILEEHIQFHSLQDHANMRIDIDQSKPPTICFHVLVERDEGAQLAAIDVLHVAEVQEQVTMA